jgi:hypothetical protein
MIYKAKRALTAAEREVERRGGQLVWMKDGVTLHSILKREGKYGGKFYHRFATLTTEEAKATQGRHGKPWPVRCEDIVGEFLLDSRNAECEVSPDATPASMESPRPADKEITMKKKIRRKKTLSITDAIRMAQAQTREQAESRIAVLKVLIAERGDDWETCDDLDSEIDALLGVHFREEFAAFERERFDRRARKIGLTGEVASTLERAKTDPKIFEDLMRSMGMEC